MIKSFKSHYLCRYTIILALLLSVCGCGDNSDEPEDKDRSSEKKADTTEVPAHKTRLLSALAKGEARQLDFALTAYLYEYREFPIGDNEGDTEVSNSDLVLMLGCPPDSPKSQEYNPRRHIFMEFKEGAKTFNDPWGHPYRVVVDTDYDGFVTIGTRRLERNSAAWSVGPNGQNEWGRGDDVTSGGQ